jgi:hypothetical protein
MVARIATAWRVGYASFLRSVRVAGRCETAAAPCRRARRAERRGGAREDRGCDRRHFSRRSRETALPL